jgi:hypothetical protein
LTTTDPKHRPDRGDEDTTILRNCCARLSEHFDTVQIVVTREQQGGTMMGHYGDGNVYARIASAQQWLKTQR